MSELSHEQVRAYLQLGRTALTPNEWLAVDEHLPGCAECRAYADDLTELQTSLAQMMHHRWDAAPVPKFAPRILARVQQGSLPHRVFNYAVGLGALVALVLLLQAFFTAQLQPVTVQSPVVTESYLAGSTATPALKTTPYNIQPTPTPPSGRDFYRVQRLTNTVTGAFRPAVSPDGQHVAYVSERDGNWDIYVLDLNTKVEARLTDDPLPDMAPSWSPAGTQIAYQHNVPAADGPVLVDYTVMDADGANKRVVFSGARWLKNEAPQWSLAGDRLAFSNGTELVVVPLDDQIDDLIIQPADQQPVEWPAWFDNQHVLYVGNGQMMFSDLAGNSQAVLVLPDPVQALVAAPPYIIYVQPQGTMTHVGRTSLDEIPAHTLAKFAAGPIEHVAVSPDGQFVAIQTDTEIVIAAAGLPSSWQQAPLFQFSHTVPPSDLLSVAWLHDSSGFVYVEMADGIPELHLAQLNLSAIDYLKSRSDLASTPGPTPKPTDTSVFGSIVTSFSPDPSATLDGSAGFSFGAAITTTSPITVIAQIVAFAVRPAETVADCTALVVPTERPFWANQANFGLGQLHYGQTFTYANDVLDADRLVVRINLFKPGVDGQLLYCSQREYTLLPSHILFTPTPYATPVLSPTPDTPRMSITPTPPPPPLQETPTRVPSSTPYEIPTPVPTATPYETPMSVPSVMPPAPTPIATSDVLTMPTPLPPPLTPTPVA